MIKAIRQLWAEESGQDVAEYAVMLAVILVIVIGTVRLIGGNAAKRRQIDAYRTRVIPAAVELAALAEESYKAGRDTLLALLDAQRSLRDVKRDYLQALLDYQAALADLEEVLGGPIA